MAMRVRFGPFVLGSETRQLHREGREVHLPDSHVGAGSLTVLMAELRTG
jgi:DNA-binding winged helix-turn-helix (wHTH) protein